MSLRGFIFILFSVCSFSAGAADEVFQFLPMKMTVTCTDHCYEYDTILSTQTVPMTYNGGTSQAHGLWKFTQEGRFYRVEVWYLDFPKSRHFTVTVMAGAEDDPMKMVSSSASFDEATVPDTIQVQTPFAEVDGKKISFGLSLTTLVVPLKPKDP